MTRPIAILREEHSKRLRPLFAGLERRGFGPFEPLVDFIVERAALPAASG
jgi:hypothetical protein